MTSYDELQAVHQLMDIAKVSLSCQSSKKAWKMFIKYNKIAQKSKVSQSVTVCHSLSQSVTGPCRPSVCRSCTWNRRIFPSGCCDQRKRHGLKDDAFPSLPSCRNGVQRTKSENFGKYLNRKIWVEFLFATFCRSFKKNDKNQRNKKRWADCDTRLRADPGDPLMAKRLAASTNNCNCNPLHYVALCCTIPAEQKNARGATQLPTQ